MEYFGAKSVIKSFIRIAKPSEPATFVQRPHYVFQTSMAFGTRWVVVVLTSLVHCVCTTTTQRVPNAHAEKKNDYILNFHKTVFFLISLNKPVKHNNFLMLARFYIYKCRIQNKNYI